MKAISVITIIIIIIAGGVYYIISNSNKTQTANSLNSAKQGIIVQEKPEDIITKLDLAYWKAAQYNDYGAAYDFFQPADKKLISKEDYVKKEKASPDLSTITDIKIAGVNVNSNTATVRISLITNTGTYPGTDTYTLIDGKWYRVMSDENKQFLGIGQ